MGWRSEEVWTKEKRTAPFHKETGSLESYYCPHTCEMRDALAPFVATLLCSDFDKGWRSAHRVVWLDEQSKKTYPMFIGKFLQLVKRYTDSQMPYFPRVRGLWGYCKRGENYGIEFLSEDHE